VNEKYSGQIVMENRESLICDKLFESTNFKYYSEGNISKQNEHGGTVVVPKYSED